LHLSFKKAKKLKSGKAKKHKSKKAEGGNAERQKAIREKTSYSLTLSLSYTSHSRIKQWK
jgi:hypothetical protein